MMQDGNNQRNRIMIQEDHPVKTKEELDALKEEVENLSKKLSELTDEELEQVSSGKRSYAPQSRTRRKKKAEQAKKRKW